MYRHSLLDFRLRKKQGFTLIELSIVLVIIGLIVGGVLTGRDLIAAAEVRAQVTQIEKYNSAVNTFRGKFNAIPGDMNSATAQQYGFNVGLGCNGQLLGKRDGNGLIDGGNVIPLAEAGGETMLFWQDLSGQAAGNLIEGQFPGAGNATSDCTNMLTLASTQLGAYFPAAKIGHSNYVYVYDYSGANWFGVSAATATSGANSGLLYSGANMPVLQAYNIDKKVDDGLPTTGNVQALYLNGSVTVVQNAPNSGTAGGTSVSCYDTATGTYSITYNNGSGGNCAVSFKMQ